jgi:hypothetical protein
MAAKNSGEIRTKAFDNRWSVVERTPFSAQILALSGIPNKLSDTLFVRREVAISDPARLFPFLLIAITLAALVPALVLGTSEFISYDGYWHLFIAKQDQWKLFLSEYRKDAHPILYHVVLRVTSTLFGDSRLECRLASIIPGVASVYLLGRIARRLCISKVVALLTMAAYGFSITMIGINIDVRAYPLALLFVIAAFYYLVDFLAGRYDASANYSLVLFGILTSLGIASEYYAVFFLVACLGVLALLWAMHSAFREGVRQWATRSWYVPVIAFGLPLAVIAYFYQTHISYHHSIAYSHIREFYWTSASSCIDFILRNLRADLNYLPSCRNLVGHHFAWSSHNICTSPRIFWPIPEAISPITCSWRSRSHPPSTFGRVDRLRAASMVSVRRKRPTSIHFVSLPCIDGIHTAGPANRTCVCILVENWNSRSDRSLDCREFLLSMAQDAQNKCGAAHPRVQDFSSERRAGTGFVCRSVHVDCLLHPDSRLEMEFPSPFP